MALLSRWEPFGGMQQEMSRFRRDFDRMFGRFGIEPAAWETPVAAYPSLNLREDDDFIYVEAELPGLKLNDLEISVLSENRLTLKGQRQVPDVPNAEWHRREREFGAFERIIELPVSVDSAKVDARLEQGILSIKMAKSPHAKPRKIPVKAE